MRNKRNFLHFLIEKKNVYWEAAYATSFYPVQNLLFLTSSESLSVFGKWSKTTFLRQLAGSYLFSRFK